jgi:hypothetical protein
MASYERGKVTAITMKVQYPDGSTKETVIDNPAN